LWYLQAASRSLLTVIGERASLSPAYYRMYLAGRESLLITGLLTSNQESGPETGFEEIEGQR